MTTCRVCAGPLTAVSDDSDLSHPSCAPADPPAFEAATHGPRTYRGVMAASWPMGCVCGVMVAIGDLVTLIDTSCGRRWVCQSCADAPKNGLRASQSGEPAVPEPRSSSERSATAEAAA